MLSYQDKIRILESIPELSRKNISNARVNFVFYDARGKRRAVASEIYLTGNGYLCVRFLEEYLHLRDTSGFINIDQHVEGEGELRALVAEIIQAYR